MNTEVVSNPESIKIYARMTKNEYAMWIDKLMAVKHIDTARTTSLPIMEAAEAIEAWGNELGVRNDGALDRWDAKAPLDAGPPVVRNGDRISVYWTDLRAWFDGTCTSTRVADADGGGTQREYRIVYEPIGSWKHCTPKQLTYYHCLDDEQWAWKEPNRP